MDTVVGSPVESGHLTPGTSHREVPLFRLYTLRMAYLIMAVGLGIFVWPVVIQHTNELAATSGIKLALLAGLGTTAVLGVRYPLQMLPILLFELIWKAIYLAAFALPMWSANQITPRTAEDISAVLWVVIFIPLIPWRYVFANYVLKRGERWK